LLSIVGAIFILPIFINPDPNVLLPFYFKSIFVAVITFIFLAWSNTFWFLVKKIWMYKIHIKKGRNIYNYIKSIKKIEMEETDSENLKGLITTISSYNWKGIKYVALRNGINASIILLILYFTFPIFVVFSLMLFCVQFIFVMIYDNQSSSQVFNDIRLLVYCIHVLFKENPESCRKFIYENKIESVRELGAIYRAVKRSKA
jgi:hypothetical protein